MRGKPNKAMSNVKLTAEIKHLQRQIKAWRRRYNRMHKKLWDRYYSWQNYFTEKKRRYHAKHEQMCKRAEVLDSFVKTVERLELKYMGGASKSKKKKYLIAMTHNNCTRLRRFLKVKRYFGRKPMKGYGLTYLTEKEKFKLHYLLNEIWPRLMVITKRESLRRRKK